MSEFVRNVKVIPNFGAGECYLYWDFALPSMLLKQVKIHKSCNGVNWQLIDAVIGEVAYRDTTFNVRNRLAIYFYRFELVINSFESVFSNSYSPLQIDSIKELGAINFVIREELKYMRHSGSDVAVLKVKTSGTLCPDCIDPETNQRLREYCETCHGTGYINGYYSPYYTYARILNEKNATKVRDQDSGAASQKVERVFRAVNIPCFEAGDIIVDIKTDDRYQVSPLQKFEFRGLAAVIVHLHVELLNRDHPAYSYPIHQFEPVMS